MDDMDIDYTDEERHEFDDDSFDEDDFEEDTAPVSRPNLFGRLVDTFGSSSTARPKGKL